MQLPFSEKLPFLCISKFYLFFASAKGQYQTRSEPDLVLKSNKSETELPSQLIPRETKTD